MPIQRTSKLVSTIADVAAEAGVSKATVSRVVSGRGAIVREETRKKVMEVVERLGFRPSTVARSLSSRRTYTVGVLVSDIANPFFSDVIHGIEDVGIESGYSFFLANTNFDVKRGTALVESMVDRRVDGVIVLFNRVSSAWLDLLERHEIAASLVAWEPGEMRPGNVNITVDFRPGIEAAANHLWDLGHRRFAHLSGPLDLHTSRERRDIFIEALGKRGARIEDISLIEGDFHMESGRKLLDTLLAMDPRPTAVFAGNDLMAHGVMSEATARGLRIPRDLSVVGLDDIWLSAQVSPPLTTVAMPRYEIGAMAMGLMLEKLDSAKSSGRNPEGGVVTQLVVRGSTAVPLQA